ncbi:UTRA domain-containing protein [Streptomyces olivaceus]|nr:UTRA domain-containing protein [Streptomyces olivaceus]MBZ6173559.1 UTRA domain-containing protein [Streptomyces olivaceus]MBZ6179526.1 UTRA domain-containing protein [Streptomyces olivaceus]GHI95636.1 hypothetical protein TPA0905_51070 [Streptomyces olivaceus]
MEDQQLLRAREPNSRVTIHSDFPCLSREGESPHGPARVYLPRELVPPGALDDASTSREATTRFAFLGPPRTTPRETVSTRLPTPDEASAFRIGIASVVLSITRVATDSTGRVVEATLLAFPGDRVDYVLTTHHVIEEKQSKG